MRLRQDNLRRRLENAHGAIFAAFVVFAAFSTYFCMYAFRKPLAAATYAGFDLWGVDYKIIVLTTQVIGYALSKFIGIKIVSEMTLPRRAKTIVVFIAVAWLALFLFAVTPPPYNWPFLFFNGLPLGMIWGLVFGFIEGRRLTEALAAGMAVSLIVASGAVKTVGRILIQDYGVNDFWMPFATGTVFMPPLLVAVWLLTLIPPPNAADIAARNLRLPMNKAERRRFAREYLPGLAALVGVYLLIAAYRDLRDNFEVELWAALGYGHQPTILTTTEIPIALACLLAVGSMIAIRDNRLAFWLNHYAIIGGGFLVTAATAAMQAGVFNPVPWMICAGFGMYLVFICYNTMLFERLIAAFRVSGNVGFLVYICDASGYVTSVLLMFYKNFSAPELSWLTFFVNASYAIGLATMFGGLVSLIYFSNKRQSAPLN